MDSLIIIGLVRQQFRLALYVSTSDSNLLGEGMIDFTGDFAISLDRSHERRSHLFIGMGFEVVADCRLRHLQPIA